MELNINNIETVKQILLEKSNGCCALCLLPIGDDFSIDHVIPKCLNGGENIDNLQSSHYKCNWLKGETVGIFTQEDYVNYYLGKSTVVKHFKSGLEFPSAISLKKYLQKQNPKNAPKTRKPYGIKEKTKKVSTPVKTKKQKKEDIFNAAAQKYYPNKPINPLVDLSDKDKGLDKSALLWNEIARNGTRRLSYEMFKSYFV